MTRKTKTVIGYGPGGVRIYGSASEAAADTGIAIENVRMSIYTGKVVGDWSFDYTTVFDEEEEPQKTKKNVKPKAKKRP